MFEDVGKTLVFLGLILVVLGVTLVLLSKFGGSIPLGRLPGDIYIKRDNFVFFFPLASSILISILLSLLFFVITVLSRKQ
ncbi:Protein of unknown function [Balnearium lithotrophicum]|jgi:quinol-cytochrome oxidoreductase complex cytochrome b subunit|uniref:DUF2905 domain-containing protein n=1 Tax=Balnearium lithotrophicum TaxID=223788 RepID=A0A521AB95_9BACT|nr:DUF2905 domain-containing protein [Balnearium lithotrophicum]SMO32031.1 Protein of unknown function [Balnearium lithotrophicum]